MGWLKLKEAPEQKIDSKEYGFNYWKIEDGYVWHQGRKLRKADPESFEVRSDHSQIFIARDKNNVFHAWSLMKNIDRDTFEEIANGYWVDKNLAYCEHETSIKPLKGKDVGNFKFIGGPYARDSIFAYYGGRALRNCANPLNLKLMTSDDCWYVGDGCAVYYDGAEIKGVDSSSWKKLKGGFSCDNKNVYFGSKKLPSVKLDTWKTINGSYSRDEKNVYCMNLKLKEADPSTWTFLKNDYSKDLHNVYFCGRLIEGADAESFEVTGSRSGKDKNQEYDGGCVTA